MYDAQKVVAGLIIFAALVALPFWLTAASGASSSKANPVYPKNETACVESKAFMKANHMSMIMDWRDIVVRGSTRTYTASDGKKWEMSLTKTCMSCHSNRAEFCTECHSKVGIDPVCWDCHLEEAE